MSESSFFKDLLQTYFIQIRDHHYAGMDSCGDCTRVENNVRTALGIEKRERANAAEDFACWPQLSESERSTLSRLRDWESQGKSLTDAELLVLRLTAKRHRG